ncbi:MAG: hypothetical protein M1812_004196 [Candelaria pacifica]|nr:MAG: hypothetical protein M1812_004196 [Candelaria pacifica]
MLALQMPQPPHLYQCGPTLISSNPPANELSNAPLAKRPKLSLEISSTSTPRTFGKSTTALTLNTICASPTVHNTYTNAYETQTSQSAISPSLRQRTPPTRRLNAYNNKIPYHQPLGVRGILRNSPLNRQLRSATLSRAPRRLFSRVKKVTYTTTLSEEIRTTKYVAAHLDLLREDEADGDGEPVQEAILDDSSTSPSRHGEAQKDQDNDTLEAPKAPVVERKRRQRNWVWTLGPIAKEAAEQSTNDMPNESVVGGNACLAT